jgi:hypothetical protein
MDNDKVVIAILAKDKAHCLPLYLKCIYEQTYPKQHIHLYIRTNDNSDETPNILSNFIKSSGEEYNSVFYDDSSINPQLKEWTQHEWNEERFRILGKIRQDSVDYAKEKGAHYFVADCDNFLKPYTLENMFRLRHCGIIGPMLESEDAYSNFHFQVDHQGYLKKGHPTYFKLLRREICGIIQVKVIHCTYFIKNEYLSHVSYDDKSGRHEYVIFSDVLRKNGIVQCLDNTEKYGYITFAETKEELDKIDTGFQKTT